MFKVLAAIGAFSKIYFLRYWNKSDISKSYNICSIGGLNAWRILNTSILYNYAEYFELSFCIFGAILAGSRLPV